jgi:excisionase family DNA binding protein
VLSLVAFDGLGDKFPTTRQFLTNMSINLFYGNVKRKINNKKVLDIHCFRNYNNNTRRLDMAKTKIDRLLTVRQVSVRLGLIPNQIYLMLKKGIIPYTTVGIGRGVIRIKESDLEAYIERKGNVTTQTD